MTARLPILTCALLAFSSSVVSGQQINGGSGAVVTPSASQLIHQAIAALERHPSIEARITQVVRLFDEQLVGSGSYLQGPPGTSQIWFELRLKVGTQEHNLLEVCDGEYLWTLRQKDGDSSLSRLNVQRVFQRQRELSADPQSFRPRLAMGGLRRLIDALATSLEFGSLEQGVEKGVRVWKLRGSWTPAQLAQLLPEQQPAIERGEPADLSQLSEHVPDHVVISLGRDDAFPYRIEYRRGETSLVTMTFSDVRFDRPLDPRRFRYQPADLKIVDITQTYLRDNGLQVEGRGQ